MVRAQQDEGDQLEDDPIDEELANLDSDALRVHTLQQREKHRQGFMSCRNQQSEPAHTRTAQARRGIVLD